MTDATNKLALLTVPLPPEQLSAISAAARRIGITPQRLAQVLLLHGLALLESGDKEIERALKGSRDSAIR
jgi:hypothetical protein